MCWVLGVGCRVKGVGATSRRRSSTWGTATIPSPTRFRPSPGGGCDVIYYENVSLLAGNYGMKIGKGGLGGVRSLTRGTAPIPSPTRFPPSPTCAESSADTIHMPLILHQAPLYTSHLGEIFNFKRSANRAFLSPN